jgi:hypothetical protein
MQLAPTSTNPVPEITSVFEFDGRQTPMVRINDVCMSSQHFVKYGPVWIPAGQHPDAVPSPSVHGLFCLNVTGHEFHVGNQGLVVADYDEHSTQDVIQKTQEFAESVLNGGQVGRRSGQNTYDLGLGADTEVYMSNQTWKPLAKIQIGDNVWNAGPVLGIVNESVSQTIMYKSVTMSSDQLVFDECRGIWKRNPASASAKHEAQIMKQLITKHGSALRIRGSDGNELYVRDYREVAHPDMESAYTEAFTETV